MIITVHHHMLNLSTKLTLRFVLRLKTSFTKLTIKLASMTSSSIGKTKTSSSIVLKISPFTRKKLTTKGVWTTKVGIGILCKTISIPFCALLGVLTSNNNILSQTQNSVICALKLLQELAFAKARSCCYPI